MKTAEMDSFEQYSFKTISDFKECIQYHGEVEFEWEGILYYITPTPQNPPQMSISQADKDETELLADTADEILEYMIDGERLREIITQVKVLFRTI